ncbi:SAM-dependent methyltransferase [Anaerobacillus arseniciselenatis]|uniref:SAM-dependent methyltransferase n=1 Tax=Anaerobacillus arseniciselenatis TaxID=85682 RepID=A0A1S2LEI4_9BACI|nr:class I SAM-dependent methyltransferase [Anaerobacillus arseniciselenatis]OIJ10932.1 SAM-dependent methyltransferase [Anaerobacillus arseniciselenatis]
MENNDNFEVLFSNLDESAQIIQNESELTYLESLVFAGECLFENEVSKPLSEICKKKIKNALENVELEKLSKEQIRKAFQLAILKGMKEATQPHHAMTPDAVAIFISYLVNKLTETKESFRILDPAVGSGNLLTAILNQANKHVSSFAIEPDETLLQLGYVSANLQQHHIEFFHQDSLTEIFIDPVDIIVADLPIGYYPNEEVANKYELKAKEGMSYTHHLMIEQSLNYTKSGGFLIFMIPNFMFESDQAKQLHTYLKEQAHIYGLLQLPKSMFKEEKHAKSIFIIRKKGENIKAPNQALLSELPSFSNKQALTEMIKSINQWFDAHLTE